MVVQLYRRHRVECEAGHPDDSRTRKSTSEWEWDKALALADVWQKAGSFNSVSLMPETELFEIPTPLVERITVVEATKAYLEKCENRGIALTTLAKYKTLTLRSRALRLTWYSCR
jgi:hypothetical protein